MPPNTIACSDWTHNPNGSWTAHDDAKPFKIGNQSLSIAASTIGRNAINAGGFDIATVLDLKCGGVSL